MKLHDLNNLKRETEERYRTLFSSSDRKLPEAFKEQVSQFDDDRITYNDYSFVVVVYHSIPPRNFSDAKHNIYASFVLLCDAISVSSDFL